MKLIAERLPDGQALASQPTLSRFENISTPAVLQKLIDFNIHTGIRELAELYTRAVGIYQGDPGRARPENACTVGAIGA